MSLGEESTNIWDIDKGICNRTRLNKNKYPLPLMSKGGIKIISMKIAGAWSQGEYDGFHQ